MKNKEEFDLNDMNDIASEWRNVSWDKIQRIRFANADHEITPQEDSFTDELKKKNE